MRTLIHRRMEQDRYFHAHPSHAAFSLIGSMLLASVIVLLLVLSAR